jgi:excisionase family DNA binding protein
MTGQAGNRDDGDRGGTAALLGPGEAARRLGVTPRTVQRWLRDGRLPAIRIGRRLKVPALALRPHAGPGAPDEARARRGRPWFVRPIRRLLVANRGELVARIARTCRRMDIACLALVTDDQRDAWWAGQADEAVPLASTYLDGPAVIRAALTAGADAIHPGYGFLAEQADFAAAVTAAGLTWVGPAAGAMRALGDKAAARRLAASLGLPVLAGYDGAGQSDRHLTRAAARIGYPVMVKPSAGGGGMGMHVIGDAATGAGVLAQARREAGAAFGDERLILERYVGHPRHLEVQLLCDRYGAAIHVGVRDCSLQRRHQKVVEEAPASHVTAALRERLGAAAVALARAAGYAGVGTVEFLLDDAAAFTFMELNARLQVEHPITEAVTGLDLVEAQLRLAAGEPLWLRQRDIRFTGHALEARLYAEDPWAGFVPATGRVEAVTWPAEPSVRVDAGVGQGDVIGTRYDPLLAKLVAWAPTRRLAIERLDAALAATRTIGVTTNRGFLRTVLAWPEMRRGAIRTDTLDDRWTPKRGADPPARVWQLAAAALTAAPAVAPAGFRLNGPRRLRVVIDGLVRSVAVAATAARTADHARRADGSIVLDVDGRAFEARLAPPPSIADALAHLAPAVGGGTVRAPLPGIVRAVRAEPGEAVAAGQPLLILEAMKMEHVVLADVAGVVVRMRVQVGQAVQRGDRLVDLA